MVKKGCKKNIYRGRLKEEVWKRRTSKEIYDPFNEWKITGVVKS